MGMKSESNLGKILGSAQLPALPQSAVRLLELSQNPENGPAEFAVPIECDPGLTSQVLRFVNSSYFGFRQEICSVKLAITLVGVRTIKNFALWSAVFSLMPNPKCGPFDLRSLWQDSLRRGIFARRIGKRLGLADCEDLFAAALLQDMALPLLAKELPEQYDKMFQLREDGLHSLSHLERKLFGWTHAEAGAMIARTWRLPESFASMIGRHVACEERHPEQQPASIRVVQLSALLPPARDEKWFDRDPFFATCESLMTTVPSVERAIEQTFADIDREFTEFAPVLKLAEPSRSLSAILARESVVA